jgi:Taurine catabolism dioxygenase TauD, TfdA family
MTSLTKEDTISILQAETFKQRGWATETIPDPKDMESYLIKIALNLGEPKQLRKSGNVVQKLVPTLSYNAHPNSLSARHSFANFPMHMDTAHWALPCRYVILGCSSVGSGNRKTKLLDFRSLKISEYEKSLLISTPFRVLNGRRSFFSTILSNQREFIRYDPGCMISTSETTTQVINIFSEKRWVNLIEEIEWKVGTVLIIDNWRVLHGRGLASKEDNDRLLYRVLVA